jgi:hypothetical protein
MCCQWQVWVDLALALGFRRYRLLLLRGGSLHLFWTPVALSLVVHTNPFMLQILTDSPKCQVTFW